MKSIRILVSNIQRSLFTNINMSEVVVRGEHEYCAVGSEVKCQNLNLIFCSLKMSKANWDSKIIFG